VKLLFVRVKVLAAHSGQTTDADRDETPVADQPLGGRLADAERLRGTGFGQESRGHVLTMMARGHDFNRWSALTRQGPRSAHRLHGRQVRRYCQAAVIEVGPVHRDRVGHVGGDRGREVEHDDGRGHRAPRARTSRTTPRPAHEMMLTPATSALPATQPGWVHLVRWTTPCSSGGGGVR
jgi:hypothetical protein